MYFCICICICVFVKNLVLDKNNDMDGEERLQCQCTLGKCRGSIASKSVCVPTKQPNNQYCHLAKLWCVISNTLNTLETCFMYNQVYDKADSRRHTRRKKCKTKTKTKALFSVTRVFTFRITSEILILVQQWERLTFGMGKPGQMVMVMLIMSV